MPYSGGDTFVPNKSLHELLWELLPNYGNDKAIIDASRDGKSISYMDLYHSSRNVACFLQKWGIQKGDFISICASGSLEFICLMIGIAGSGAIVAPCNPSYRKNEILQQFAISRPRMVFVDEEAADRMKSVKEDVSFLEEIFVIGQSTEFVTFAEILKENPSSESPKEIPIDPANDLVAVPHSSGTTGMPKCVMMTHQNYVASIATELYASGELTERDTSQLRYCDRPMYHLGGYLAVLISVANGILTITETAINMEKLYKNIETYRITFALCFPPMLIEMVNSSMADNYDLSSLKFICSTGSIPPLDVVHRIIKMHKVFFIEGYGMTEASGFISMGVISDDNKSDLSGKVRKGFEVKITNHETGVECSVGCDGEIRVRGPSLMIGYMNNPEANAKAFDEEGWFRTGDIGRFDEDGNLFVVGRYKEIIKYKTMQVSPVELESVIIRHPNVADAAVIGVPDKESGEVPKAFVVPLHPALSVNDVQNIINENLVDYKRLRGGVEFVKSIPKTSTGKIQRNALKKMAGF